MEKNVDTEIVSIDLTCIFRNLLKHMWIIVVSVAVCAVCSLVFSMSFIKPTYSASIRLYVNNVSFSENNSITSSTIDMARKLVDTYREVLHSKPTYEQIKDKANAPYTVEQLSKMISSGASNNTEVMFVTVVSDDPYEAAKIANCVAEVLPSRISTIIDGASVEIIEKATPNLNKISPSISKNVIIGGLLGCFVSVAVICLISYSDNKIHSEAYIVNTYNCPILAKIRWAEGKTNKKDKRHRVSEK